MNKPPKRLFYLMGSSGSGKNTLTNALTKNKKRLIERGREDLEQIKLRLQKNEILVGQLPNLKIPFFSIMTALIHGIDKTLCRCTQSINGFS